MTRSDDLIAPMAALLDRIVPDPIQRDQAKLALLKLQTDAAANVSPAAAAEATSADRWTSRARPTFLYVMYALLLWSAPMGLVAAVSPATARDIAGGVAAYLNAIPEPLYALFATGYLGYTVARSWGKANGSER
jgi:hypothetical protein